MNDSIMCSNNIFRGFGLSVSHDVEVIENKLSIFISISI